MGLLFHPDHPRLVCCNDFKGGSKARCPSQLSRGAYPIRGKLCTRANALVQPQYILPCHSSWLSYLRPPVPRQLNIKWTQSWVALPPGPSWTVISMITALYQWVIQTFVGWLGDLGIPGPRPLWLYAFQAGLIREGAMCAAYDCARISVRASWRNAGASVEQ